MPPISFELALPRKFGHLPGTPPWQKTRPVQYNLKFTALPLKHIREKALDPGMMEKHGRGKGKGLTTQSQDR